MDLGVIAVNRLRGQPDNTPLWKSVPRVEPHVLPLPQATAEKRKLLLLEPGTRKLAEHLLEWSRARGVRTYLGETYRSLADQMKIPEDKTGITRGKIGWHQVGRAFHLILKTPRGAIFKDAYPALGDEAERRGGVWLGRTPLMTPKGPVTDLAHFEYHPGISIGRYRRSNQADREMASAAKRAARYG